MRRVVSLWLPCFATDRQSLIRRSRGGGLSLGLMGGFMGRALTGWRRPAPSEGIADPRLQGRPFSHPRAVAPFRHAAAAPDAPAPLRPNGRDIGTGRRQVHFAGLSGQRQDQAGPHEEAPFATILDTGGRCLIAAVNAAAAGAGIGPGQPLADARAMLPGLAVVPADPAGDAAVLDRLADWCGRYTPWAAVECADDGSGAGLWLDITGCAHLFAGEAALLADLVGRLRAFGYAARAGLAGTPGAAWAAARFLSANADGFAILASGEERAALEALPVAALRLAPADCESLAQVGLRRVGDLEALPRSALSRRFGASLLRRLDQALGRVEEPVSPRQPVPPQRVRLAFAEPIAAPEDLAAALRRLLGALCRSLAVAEEGARRLELMLFRVDGSVQRTGIGTSRPTRDPEALERLLAPQIERIDPGFGIEVMVLAAPQAEPLSSLQLALAASPSPNPLPQGEGAFSPQRDPEPSSRDKPPPPAGGGWGRGGLGEVSPPPNALAELVDRLGGRFGLGSIHRFVPHESHLPERSVEQVAPFAKTAAAAGWPATPPRPARLLRNPEPVETLSPFALLQAPDCAGPAELFDEFPKLSSPGLTGQSRAGRDAAGTGLALAWRPGSSPGMTARESKSGEIGTLEPYMAPVLEETATLAAFRWRGRMHRVRRAEGPERIAPEWWRPAGKAPGRDPGSVRDYYRVEDADGRRFWLYREVPAPAVPHPGAGCSAPVGTSGVTLVRKGSRDDIDDGETEVVAWPLTPPLTPLARSEGEESASGPRWFLHGLFG